MENNCSQSSRFTVSFSAKLTTAGDRTGAFQTHSKSTYEAPILMENISDKASVGL